MKIEDIPPDIAKKVAEANRDINTDHDWWECEVDHFKEDMQAIGIHVERTYFSGFWCQGDGACFEGRVKNWQLFLPTLGYTDPFLLQLASEVWGFECSHRGRYYHHKSVEYSQMWQLPYSDEDADFIQNYMGITEPLTTAVALNQLVNIDGKKIMEECREAFENHMQDLYRRLQREYEYLASDTAVLEALEANDLLEEEVNNHTMENANA